MREWKRCKYWVGVAGSIGIGAEISQHWIPGWQMDTLLLTAFISGGTYLTGMFAWVTLQRVPNSLLWRYQKFLERHFPLPGDAKPSANILLAVEETPSRLQKDEAVHQVAQVSANLGATLTIWDRCTRPAALQHAWEKILQRSGAPGPDGVSAETFAAGADRFLAALAKELAEGRYEPQTPKWIDIRKPSGGLRRIGLLNIRDRIVLNAINGVLTVYWDSRFAPSCHAYRPRRSAQQAIETVERIISYGCRWAFNGDVEAYFDRIPLKRLDVSLSEWLPDQRLCGLIMNCVKHTTCFGDHGLVQGSSLSPLLSNLYLTPLDRAMEQSKYRYIRYADNILVLASTESEASNARRRCVNVLTELGLNLNAEKSEILCIQEKPLRFLGFDFRPDGKSPSAQALEKINEALEEETSAERRQQIRAGWEGYYGTATESKPKLPAVDEKAVEVEHVKQNENFEEAAISSLILERYVGRSEIHARFWQAADNERKGYLPCRKALTQDDIRQHLAGKITVGTYLHHSDGTTRHLVIDIDSLTMEAGPPMALRSLSVDLVEFIRQKGWLPSWFESGGKGFHIWLCFQQPIDPAGIIRQIDEWLDLRRPLPVGATVEYFPQKGRIHPGSMGPLIRLPLGKHPITRRPSRMLNDSGHPVANMLEELQKVPWSKGEQTKERAGAEERENLLLPERVRGIFTDCNIVRGILENAVQRQHVRHGERLALAHLMCGLGEPGRIALHQLLSLCSPYSPTVTNQWLARTNPGRKPIACNTLAKWLKDYQPTVACPCGLTKGHGSPVNLLQPRQQDAEPSTAATIPPNETSTDVADWMRTELQARAVQAES